MMFVPGAIGKDQDGVLDHTEPQDEFGQFVQTLPSIPHVFERGRPAPFPDEPLLAFRGTKGVFNRCFESCCFHSFRARCL